MTDSGFFFMNDSNSILVNCVPLSVTKVLYRKAVGSKDVQVAQMIYGDTEN